MNIEEAIEKLKRQITVGKCEKNIGIPVYISDLETILTAYEKEKEKNKKAIEFINNENNYFEDGENWQNILKIKDILEE